jgi:hypothetical protein
VVTEEGRKRRARDAGDFGARELCEVVGAVIMEFLDAPRERLKQLLGLFQ